MANWQRALTWNTQGSSFVSTSVRWTSPLIRLDYRGVIPTSSSFSYAYGLIWSSWWTETVPADYLIRRSENLLQHLYFDHSRTPEEGCRIQPRHLNSISLLLFFLFLLMKNDKRGVRVILKISQKIETEFTLWQIQGTTRANHQLWAKRKMKKSGSQKLRTILLTET